MPNQVISINEDNAESVNKTRMTVNKELKGLRPGKAVLGYVGEIPNTLKPEETANESLNDKEKEYRKRLQEFILKNVEPPILSENRPNPAKDRVSFVKKVERQTLGELRRFWKGKIPESPTEEDVSELNRKWTDLSP